MTALRPPRAAQGSSLLETLLALLILMIGMLALAKTQANSLLHARDAQIRAEVHNAVEALAEAMLANQTAISRYISSSYTPTLATPDCEVGQSCDALQQAQADLQHFQQALQQIAGNAEQLRGVVCRAPDNAMPTLNAAGCQASGPLSIRVVWRSRGQIDRSRPDSWQEYAYVQPLFLP
ncbi:type IV pilus modification protein PilV [Neisseriaceae bacterium TC5R-5]|nr:type IV pilus modification protein PilV [Neisseriaceae bacterium TC5R-5]